MTTVRSGTFSEQGTTSSAVVTKPSGAASGDKLVVFISTEDSATVTCSTRPTGFTKVNGGTEADPVAIDTTGADMRGFAYEKTLGGSEPASYTFTMSASTWVSWHAVCTNGASGAVVSTAVRTAAVQGGAGNASLSAVTLTADQLAVAAGATYETGAANSVTNWTEPTGSTRMGFYRTATTATNELFDNNATATRWWSITLVLDAAGGGGSPQTWNGSAATVTMTAASGTFTPGAVTWTGSAATMSVAAASGTFTPGAVTWSGSAAAVTVAATSGTFTPGTATWAGSAAAITIAATSGSFTPGAVTWNGSAATITITATSGTFTTGGSPQTWNGSAAAVTVAATSGTFVPGGAVWAGSSSSVALNGISGVFLAGPVTWTGSAATITVTSSGGFFTAGLFGGTGTGGVSTSHGGTASITPGASAVVTVSQGTGTGDTT